MCSPKATSGDTHKRNHYRMGQNLVGIQNFLARQNKYTIDNLSGRECFKRIDRAMDIVVLGRIWSTNFYWY
eukprot:scaffold23140_cov178-Amphora_coffeaeformis.AAC.5